MKHETHFIRTANGMLLIVGIKKKKTRFFSLNPITIVKLN